MRIEQLAVNLRTRTPWEASDLGVMMLKRWWQPVMGVWFAVYFPFAIAFTTAFPEQPWIALVALWWMKPLFDRFVQHVLSRSVFGDVPSVGATLRAWREILRGGLIGDLTFRRIGLRRSFYLPITQLEGADPRLRADRIRSLGRRVGFHAAAITIACLAFEFIAAIGIDAMVLFMSPEDPDQSDFDFGLWWAGGFDRNLIEPLDVLYYVFAVSLIEPLYVAQGFALYLARRTHLEGWDIELGLRRIANRLAGSAGALLLSAALALSAVPGGPAFGAPATVHEAKARITELLDTPAFDTHQDVTEWRLKGARDDSKRDPGGRWPFLDAIAGLARTLAWLVAFGLVVAAIWYGRRFIQPAEGAHARRDVRGVAFGLDVRPDSLPADMHIAVRDLIAQKRFRDALSLLYRGALSVLIFRYQINVNPGDTERKCLRAARAVLPPQGAEVFAELIRAWEHTAYSDRSPQQHECEHLLLAWTTHFGTAVEPGKADTAREVNA